VLVRGGWVRRVEVRSLGAGMMRSQVGGRWVRCPLSTFNRGCFRLVGIGDDTPHTLPDSHVELVRVVLEQPLVVFFKTTPYLEREIGIRRFVHTRITQTQKLRSSTIQADSMR